MRVLALVLAILGGLCTVLGILTAVEVVPAFIAAGETTSLVAYNTAGWGGLAVILLLGCIAALHVHHGHE
ncbi:MAG TPA: hypothetical protein G4N93_02945 [Dehalococcoidia bacterium]|nr:hypothetical protein [Dehalococcoidia bacterium]